MSNLAVRITADVVDLQTKFAVAKAEVQGLTSEMNKLARASAAGTIDTAGTQRLQQLSASLIAARSTAAGFAGQLDKAGVSLNTFGRAAEGMSHGSISTATREFRALFDELSSGRTRNTPGTIAILLNKVLGLGPAGLGAVGGIAALAGGIAYLAVKAADADKALSTMELASLRAGNDASREALQQLTQTIAQLPKVSEDSATQIVSALAGVHLPFQALQAAARIAAEQMQQTGQSADQTGQQLAKALAPNTSATEVAKQLQGSLAQAQVDAAKAADKSGNANAVLAQKLQLLTEPLTRARAAVKDYSAANWFAAAGLAQVGIVTPQLLKDGTAQQVILQSNEQAWLGNATAIRQYSAAVQALPAQKTLDFSADKDNLRGLEEQIEAEKQLGEIRQRQNETALEWANQTLDAMESAAIQAAEQARTIAQQDADTTIQLSRTKIEAEKEALTESVTATSAAASAKYTLLKQLTDQEYQLDLQQLQNELATLKDQPVEYDRVFNQIRELKARNVQDLATLDKEAAQATAKQVQQQVSLWKGSVSEIESAEGGMVNDLIGRHKTLSQSLLQLSGQLVEGEIRNDLKAMTTRILLAKSADVQEKALEQGGYLYHAMIELRKMGTTQTSQSAQTQAVAAGTAARTTAQTTGAAAGIAEQGALGAKSVMSSAAQAFSGTYASVSSIPVVGWILAPAAAAAAFAAVAGYEGLASLDVGAWNVPQDMPAQIHRGEMVVPRTFAEGIRQGATTGGGDDDDEGGGDTHYHIHANDAKSFSDMISQPGHRSALAKAMRTHFGR
jgi:hypothetical protein